MSQYLKNYITAIYGLIRIWVEIGVVNESDRINLFSMTLFLFII